MSRKRRTISYPVGFNPDLEELLEELRSSRNSPYWNRSLSDIGGMILSQAALDEVAKYIREDDRNPGDGRHSAADS